MAKNKKENIKAMETKKAEIVKTITESDLSIDDFNEEASKVKTLNDLISQEKGPKMDGQSRAALIKGLFKVGCVGGLMLWECRHIFLSRDAKNEALRD